MIILAAAIILSLSNSGIIGKANKAKTDSDTASLKEYVNTLKADWMLDEAKIKESGVSSFSEYAENKLKEAGYNVGTGKGAYTVTEEGEVYEGLSEGARDTIISGIKIGDVVTGYTIESTTYKTSGVENTAPNYFEASATPQTITTNTQVTWRYLGVDENGNIEIMADLDGAVAPDNTKMDISGEGGYLNGPTMLNTVCEALYSKAGVGTARSMDIDDVNNILGYTGDKGSYLDTEGNTVKTEKALTVKEISEKLGTSFGSVETPDGKDVNTYISNKYTINKINDVKKMTNSQNIGLVYCEKNTYWLASSCVSAYFAFGAIDCGERYVSFTDVDVAALALSGGSVSKSTNALRPVITLAPNVKLTPNTTKTVWSLS